MSATISFDEARSPRRPGIAAGIVVSLALHAVLIFGYRLSSPPAAKQPARSMTVWLQAPKPLARVEPPKPEPKPERKRQPAPARERTTVAATPPRTEEAAREPVPPAESQTITLPREQDPLYADQQPKAFDIEAAKKAARKAASEKAAPGTLAAQLEAHPIAAEPNGTELGRKIEKAGKTDCLKSASGAGLLAPLFWALDKHCKF
ncbi:hypothetical protein GTP44_01400 [Duganella sp. FT50W]|uniref:Uncharacterized protein n=1 Tax=Duganella lactea TaxID=2692173 RepID=A0A6L8MG01_9BURK|nr:hypothetical protein [Duganella lactea]MYM80616.1 hypothetical protein [Duganella lactea]